MNEDIIEDNIQAVATSLARNISEKEIIEVYLTLKFNITDIIYLLEAGKILYNDRKSAPLKQGSFKRVK